MTATKQSRTVTLLADPDPRPVKNLLFSTDDHIVEPPEMFEGRVPTKFGDAVPHVIERDGMEFWLVEGNLVESGGLNAVAGRPPAEWNGDPDRFEDIRLGCYKIDARIRDMDINGIYASVNFPSRLAGFGGTRFSEFKDQELGLACVRAWNSFFMDEWVTPHPDRIVGVQIPWLSDVTIAAAEIRANAAKNFKAVSFPEIPSNLGFPALNTGHWDPFLEACEETETVICLHTGSSSGRMTTIEPGSPGNVAVSLFPACALVSAMNWLWSGVLTRYPKLKILMAEGGIGWIPMMLDRLEYMADHAGLAFLGGWHDELEPADVLRRNFWHAIFSDPSSLDQREHIGLGHITIEADYPHGDGTWPDSQAHFDAQLGHLPERDRNLICWGNAAKLFRHPLPEGYTIPD
jgi:predicted TIM-barrel fold metal-dependent hydrolase